MKTRWTMVISLMFLAALLVFFPVGGKKQAAMAETRAALLTPAAGAQENSMENPYTKDNPGPWAGKEGSHVPQIAYVKAGSGLKVTVKVAHPMDPKAPHYIMWIKLLDGDGNTLGQKDFVATDPAPIATFDLTSAPQKLKAYERCNLHGIWLNQASVSAQ